MATPKHGRQNVAPTSGKDSGPPLPYVHNSGHATEAENTRPLTESGAPPAFSYSLLHADQLFLQNPMQSLVHIFQSVLQQQMKVTCDHREHGHQIQNIPDPETFFGDSTDLDRFICKCNFKLTRNPDCWATEDQKATHFYLLLGGKAKETMRNYIDLDDNFAFSNLDGFLDTLKLHFGDYDPRGSARQKLRAIRMANRDFLAFLPEFQRYAIRSGFSSNALMEFFHEGLSKELRLLLVD